MSSPASILFWFRRDLRIDDNAGLYHALKSSQRVYCVFIFDRDILDALPSKVDRRVEFIWESVAELKAALQAAGGDLIIRHTSAKAEITNLAAALGVDAVYTNDDYEPQAIARDAEAKAALAENNIGFETFKDTVIFEKNEVLTQMDKPFSVFTPYKNAWLRKLNTRPDFYLKSYPIEKYSSSLAKTTLAKPLMPLETLGFERSNLNALKIATGMSGAHALLEDFLSRIQAYKEARDFPAIKGVSYLSFHNRFGTISIRKLASLAYAETLHKDNVGAQTWLSELIWRDFYFQILYHAPHVVERAFKPEYDALLWPNDKKLFAAWCEARTGFPIVDAAMRQLNQTGFMHNRLRMIVASFLSKDLLVDYRWGEQFFADNLNDFDLSANNGGWQWAASTGCDAQPYFRIFNPVTQSERFDARGKFIRRYLPELANVPDKYIHAPWTMPPLEQEVCGVVIGKNYPAPIVDHAVQRGLALEMYKGVKGVRR